MSRATWSWLAKNNASSAARSGCCARSAARSGGSTRLVRLEIIRDDLVEPLLSIVSRLRLRLG